MVVSIGHGLELIATSGQDLAVGTIEKMMDPIVVLRIVDFEHFDFLSNKHPDKIYSYLNFLEDYKIQVLV